MMIAALLALGFGAVAGIYLATRHFLRKRLPASVALLHGLGGATGFTLVLLTVVREPSFGPIRDVLYFLIATVVLGVVNLLFHIRKVRHRTSLILLHGMTAVTSAGLLIRAIMVHVPAGEDAAAPAQAAVTQAAPDAASPSPSDLQAAADSGAPALDAQAAAPDAGAAGTPDDAFSVDESVRQVLVRPIQFETKSAELSPESHGVITAIAGTLNSHPEVKLIEVQGHADERGEDSRNVALTRARAAAVVEALVRSGVERKRLRSAGYGARCPEDKACQTSDAPDSCHTPESWQRDRRVVFMVLEVGKASYKGELVCARGAELIPAQHRRFHTTAD